MLHQTADGPSIVDLGQQVYDLSLVRRDKEFITGPSGDPIEWLLDSRVPMRMGAMARDTGRAFVKRLRERGVVQIAGYGMGAYPVVCAALNAPGAPTLRGGFVRKRRKEYGRHRLVEGPITKNKSLVLMDDILNSGTSALHALEVLREEGYDVVGFLSLFEFTWSQGRSRLQAEGLWVDSLIDLCIGDEDGTASSDSV